MTAGCLWIGVGTVPTEWKAMGAVPDPGPMVVSSGPLLEPRVGWRSTGMPWAESVAFAGSGVWVAAWSHTADNAFGPAGSDGRILARVIRSNPDGTPDLDPTAAPDPVAVADTLAANGQLSVVGGRGGAWIVWPSTVGMWAQWMNAGTGRPEGESIRLADAPPTPTLRTASDGTTAWVVWSPGHHSTVLNGVTLRGDDGPPRLVGRFSLSARASFSNGHAVAARDGKALVVEVGLVSGGPAVGTRTHQIEADGGVIGSPNELTGPAPDRAENLYGLMSYGTGWLVVWAQALTPSIPGRIVYGRPLEPDGTASADPVRALYIEPGGGSIARGVASANGVGIIVAPQTVSNETLMHAAVVRPGQPASSIALGQSDPFRFRAVEPPLAVGFDGSQVAFVGPRGDWNSRQYFVEELTLANLNVAVGRWPVSRGEGIQEEPALTWLPGSSVVAWQQISELGATPQLVVRRRGADGKPIGSDVVITGDGTGTLSSPAIATNGSRLLLVARRGNSPAPGQIGISADTDDVMGVLIENQSMIGLPFLIAGGPGSQRAARVAAWADGFCVAWREEINPSDSEILYRIRAAFYSRDGRPISANPTTLAASVEELAAPALAATPDGLTAVVWRSSQNGIGKVEGTVIFGAQPNAGPKVSLFRDSALARSPDVLWDGQSFLVTARLHDNIRDVDSLGLALLVPGATAPVPLPDIESTGREPALAALGNGSAAILWLDQANSSASSKILMTTRAANGEMSTTRLLMTGVFDRDTLVARGDGHGRVQASVLHLNPQDSGVRVHIFAPAVNQVPAIQQVATETGGTVTPWPTLSFQWRSNVLFPARLAAVQASRHLDTWDRVPDGLGVVDLTLPPDGPTATFRTTFNLPNPEPAAPFYRLQAVLAE